LWHKNISVFGVDIKMNLEILKVNRLEDIQVISEIAYEIWHEHFTPIIGIEQVEYMINKFQCFNAIKDQIHSGYEYYLFKFKGEFVGYTGIQEKDGKLFLSKLYVKKDYRGMKISKDSIKFMANLCQVKGLGKIWFTVNKNNDITIAAYEKMGFIKTRMQKTDIGDGFFMDDFIMEKTIDLKEKDI
jgi:ribosomal protein S18 acetylase RimI-like enzyme